MAFSLGSYARRLWQAAAAYLPTGQSTAGHDGDRPAWLEKEIKGLRDDHGTVDSVLHAMQKKRYRPSLEDYAAIMGAERDRSWDKLARLIRESARGGSLPDHVNYWIEEHPTLGYRIDLADVISRVERLPEAPAGVMSRGDMATIISSHGRQISPQPIYLNYSVGREALRPPFGYQYSPGFQAVLGLSKAWRRSGLDKILG